MTKRRPAKSRALPGHATSAQVAALAGVSKMTVSRVVNGSRQVTEETRRAVEVAIEQLGFVPSQLARGLTGRRLGVVALLVPDLANPFFTQVIHGCEGAMGETGFTILLGNSGESAEQEKSLLAKAAALHVDGLILGATGDEARAAIQHFQVANIPVVLIDRSVAGVEADLVASAGAEPARVLTKHLLDHGHKRIAMVAGPPDASTSRERIDGYRQALLEAGVTPDESLIVGGAFTREVGKAMAHRLLLHDDRPTAVVAANSLLAFGLIDGARELDLCVPDNLAIASFDDVEVTAGEPFLTCADQSAEDVGRIAALRLLQRMDGDDSAPEAIVLDTLIRIRTSCGCSGAGVGGGKAESSAASKWTKA